MSPVGGFPIAEEWISTAEIAEKENADWMFGVKRRKEFIGSISGQIRWKRRRWCSKILGFKIACQRLLVFYSCFIELNWERSSDKEIYSKYYI